MLEVDVLICFYISSVKEEDTNLLKIETNLHKIRLILFIRSLL